MFDHHNHLNKERLCTALAAIEYPNPQQLVDNLFKAASMTTHGVPLLQLADLPDDWYAAFKIAYEGEIEEGYCVGESITWSAERLEAFRQALEPIRKSLDSTIPRRATGDALRALVALSNPEDGEFTISSSLAEAYRYASDGHPGGGFVLNRLARFCEPAGDGASQG